MRNSSFFLKIGTLLLSLMNCALVLWGQSPQTSYYSLNLNSELGLSESVVNDIAEDGLGFIWLATNDGLNRYDGYHFGVFRRNDLIPNGLPTSKILKIHADNNGHLWLKTDVGTLLFNLRTNRVITPSFLAKSKVMAVGRHDDKSTWLATNNNGLCLINARSLALLKKSGPIPFKKDDKEFISLKEFQNVVYCVTISGNIYAYNRNNKEWQYFTNPINSNSSLRFNYVALNRQGVLYLSSLEADLEEFNTKTKTFSISAVHAKKKELAGINYLYLDEGQNILYLATYGQGIFEYNLNTQDVNQHKQNDETFHLSSNYPISILKDRKNVLWIGYDGKGLDVFAPNIKKFKSTSYSFSKDQFGLKYVRTILEDSSGIIWYATAGSGLVSQNRATGQFQLHQTQNKKLLMDNFVMEMCKVQNSLWLGFNGNGIGIFDLKSKSIKRVLDPKTKKTLFTTESIWSLYYDSLGHSIWIGTRSNGLKKINLNNHGVTDYLQKEPHLFENNGIRCIQSIEKNILLIGTENGLIEYNTNTQRFKKIFSTIANKNQVIPIRCIYADSSDYLWLGTDGFGLIVLKKDYSFVANITVQNRLGNNVVYGILPGTKNSIWMSSNAGLSNVIITNKNFMQPTIYNYNQSNGLQSNEFSTSAYTQLRDGSLVFGGINGVNIFKDAHVRPSTIVPKTIITDFSVQNKKLTEDLLTPYLKDVKLQHSENSFAISYNTVGFTLPEKIKYKYRLVGYDKNWIYAEGRTFVSYTNLDAGDYEFRVTACNNDGLWSNEFTKLTIHIATPFYKTIWFYLLVTCGIGLLIWTIYTNRMRQLRAKEQIRIQYNKELAEVEMKALRAQINPHFLFNALNSINNFILKNENQKARKYLVKFSQLVRNILKHSTNKYVSLREELDTINLYIQIESMRFDNQFSYEMKLDERIDSNAIAIPALLLQPYIENAIWHGLLHKDGFKTIQLIVNRREENKIEIEITDNGIGRKMAESLKSISHEQSFGMELGNKRIKLITTETGLKGNIEIIDLYENEKATGTKIFITLPILNLHP